MLSFDKLMVSNFRIIGLTVKGYSNFSISKMADADALPS